MKHFKNTFRKNSWILRIFFLFLALYGVFFMIRYLRTSGIKGDALYLVSPPTTIKITPSQTMGFCSVPIVKLEITTKDKTFKMELTGSKWSWVPADASPMNADQFIEAICKTKLNPVPNEKLMKSEFKTKETIELHYVNDKKLKVEVSPLGLFTLGTNKYFSMELLEALNAWEKGEKEIKSLSQKNPKMENNQTPTDEKRIEP
jgi:hypothetical protein